MLAKQQEGQFKKDLGLFSLITMSLGTMIGSGWLMLPGIVASKAGPASVLAWLFAGLAILIVAVVYAELGAAWPAPGAVAKYPYLSHGDFAGHLGGWAALVAYLVTPPAEAVAVTAYAGQFAPALVHKHAGLSPLGIVVAIVILGLLGLLNYYGVKHLATLQNWVTVIKYIPITVFIIAVGAFAFHPMNFTAFGGFAPMGASGFLLATASTVFAFIGFRQALDFGAEAKNPGRDLPRALVFTILIGTVTYVLIGLMFVGGIHWNALAGEGVKAGDWSTLSNLSASVYNLAAATGLAWVAWLIFVDGLLSPNGPNATNVGTVPRVAYTMAENGSMPRLFLKLHVRYGTPGPGLLIAFVLEALLLLLTAGGYGQLIASVNVAFLMAFAMGPVAFGVLRKTAPNVERPFRLRGGGFWAPLAFILASLLMFWSAWPLTGQMLGILFIGVLIYIAYGFKRRVKLASVRYGMWLIVYLLSMVLISYLGDDKFGGRGVIPFGWDMGLVAVVCLVVYYWGVRQGVAFDKAMGSAANDPVESEPEPLPNI